MAFKPFDYFRKHQKPVFAVMAIICMLVFILQFSQGDALTQLLALGGDKNRGELAETVNKKKIYRGDLAALREQRTLATEFMSFFVGAGFQAGREFSEATSPSGLARDLSRERDLLSVFGRFESLQKGSPESPERIRADIEIVERFVRQGTYSNKTRMSPQEGNALNNLLLALRLTAWRDSGGLREFIFGGSPSTEDLLDHQIWLDKADQLKIELVEAGVRDAITNDAGREIIAHSFAEDERVKEFLKQSKHVQRRVQPADLLLAVTNEYRAAIAQEVLLGRGQGLRAYLAPVRGYEVATGSVPIAEFAAIFRAKRTQINVALLPITTKNFIGQGEPSREDLTALYDRYRTVVAQPNSNQLGLKIQRKVEVQYVSLPTDLPAFKQVAEVRLLPQVAMVRRLLANATTLPAGGGVAPAIAANMVPLFDRKDPDRTEPVLATWVAFASENYYNWLSPSEKSTLSLAEWSTLDGLTANPRQICSLLGVAISGNEGTPLVLSTTGMATSTAHLARVNEARAVRVANMVAAHSSPLTIPFQDDRYEFPGVTSFLGKDLVPSLKTMGPILWSEALKKASHDFFAAEAMAFAEQLRKVAGNHEEAVNFLTRVNEGKPVKIAVDLKAAVTLKAGDLLLQQDPTFKVGDRVYTFHLKDSWHSMKAPAVKARVDDKNANPELAPLLTAIEAKEPVSDPNQGPANKFTLGDMIFNKSVPYQCQGWALPAGYVPLTLGGGEFEQQQQPDLQAQFRRVIQERVVQAASESKQLFLFWYSESVGEKDPTSLEQVRPEAVLAWRTLQARKQAREAAAKIKQKLTPPAGPDDLAAQAALREAVRKANLEKVLGDVKPIFLHDVCEIEQEMALTKWKPWNAKPKELTADFRYPRSNLGSQLLTLQKPGDSIIVFDQPEEHYYLAVLMGPRMEPSADSLREALSAIDDKPQPTILVDTFWMQEVITPRRAAYRKDLLRQLRVAAVGADKIDDDGNYILPESFRKGNSNVD